MSTFKALCESAAFTAGGMGSSSKLSAESIHEPVQEHPEGKRQPGSQAAPSVHIDIQVHIAPESSPEQIDQIFKSMAKHLYGKGDA